jgi:hypothetical protein
MSYAALPLVLLLALKAAPGARAALPPPDLNLKPISAATPAFLTQNSVRRDPRDADEVAHVLRLPGCTGFLVKNTAGRFYAATARHCVKYRLAEACEEGLPFRLASNGIEARCRRVVVASEQDDLAIVEIDFGRNSRRAAGSARALRLAAFRVAAGTDLKLAGYPADSIRRRALTVTENCGDTTGHGRDFFTGNRNDVGQPVPRPDSGRPESLLRPLHRAHNCSVYAGNSGGAFTLRGTDIAVGIPDAYDNGRGFRIYDPSRSAVYETSAGFVARNRSALRDAGIVIAPSAED